MGREDWQSQWGSVGVYRAIKAGILIIGDSNNILLFIQLPDFHFCPVMFLEVHMRNVIQLKKARSVEAGEFVLALETQQF
jgi:hypothetical protein